MKRAKLIITAALFLIACVSVATSWHDQCETQTITGSFTVSEFTPTPTPTPSPTGTPSPINTSVPAPALKLTINIIGKVTEWPRDEGGAVLADVYSPSFDQRVIFTMSRGTIALDADSNPLNHIFAGVVDPFTKSPPLNLPDKSYFIDLIEFAPSGATFSGQTYVKLLYEDTDIPAGLDESYIKVIQLNSKTGEWEYISNVIDKDSNTVTFSINHFSTYALILFPVPDSIKNIPAYSTVSPSTAETTCASCNCWIWILTILVTEFAAIDIMLIIRWRNKKRASRNWE